MEDQVCPCGHDTKKEHAVIYRQDLTFPARMFEQIAEQGLDDLPEMTRDNGTVVAVSPLNVRSVQHSPPPISVAAGQRLGKRTRVWPKLTRMCIPSEKPYLPRPSGVGISAYNRSRTQLRTSDAASMTPPRLVSTRLTGGLPGDACSRTHRLNSSCATWYSGDEQARHAGRFRNLRSISPASQVSAR